MGAVRPEADPPLLPSRPRPRRCRAAGPAPRRPHDAAPRQPWRRHRRAARRRLLPPRFGSSLNPHFQFHLVVLDGVFTETDGEVRFHEAPHFSADDARALELFLRRRVLRLFQRRGLLDEHTVDDMLTWQGAGGFSLDASVRIHGSDRAGRERLLRYCARPPFALERLRIERESGARDRRVPAGAGGRSGAGHATASASELGGVRRVFYQPARPTPDGRTLLALSPLEFLEVLPA